MQRREKRALGNERVIFIIFIIIVLRKRPCPLSQFFSSKTFSSLDGTNELPDPAVEIGEFHFNARHFLLRVQIDALQSTDISAASENKKIEQSLRHFYVDVVFTP